MNISRRQLMKTSILGSSIMLAAPALSLRGAYGADDPILVGSLVDQSGPLGASGQPMVDALNVAVAEINATGGLIGRPVKVIHYDTQSNNQLYSQYAQELAVKEKVAVVHGGITSSSREAIRPIFSRFKTLYFYNCLYEGGVCDRNTFCSGTTPAQTVEKLVPYAMSHGGGKKVYIIAADYNYGQITAKWMKKFVQDNGGEVLGMDFFPLDLTNYGSAISKIQAAKPDLILSGLVAATAFYRQWGASGMKDQIPIASSTFGLINEPSILDDAESRGILGSYGYFEELQTPASMSFVEKVKKANPKVPYISEQASDMYEGFYLWANAVKQAGTIDRIKVIEALEGGMSFDGPTGKVVVDNATHHMIRNAYLAVVKNRKWEVLETYTDAKPVDTASVCDLVARPNENRQFEISL